MPTHWARGLNEGAQSSAPTAFQWVPLQTYLAGYGGTIRRTIVRWHFQMSLTADTWPLASAVPGAYGITTTTSAAGSGDPAAPTLGPFSNPNAYDYWWWDGLDWYPEYVQVSGGGSFGCHDKIDVEVNHVIDRTVNTTVWIGFEQDDDNGAGGSYFSLWVFAAYYQLLVTGASV